MPERYAGREQLRVIARPSERIAEALRWATPDASRTSRIRFRSSQPKPILRYPDAGNITISADYGIHAGFPRPGFGLKVDGEKRIYNTPGEIEILLARNGLGFSGQVESRQNEALLVHGIIHQAESHRPLPQVNSRQIEGIILQASSIPTVQTVAELDGKARVYFPFTSQAGNSDGAKMVQVITSRTGEELQGPSGKHLKDREIAKARELVNLASVRQVLDAIPDHAVTIESHRDERFPGAEFIKITDAKGNEHIVHKLLSEEITGELLTGKKLMVVFGATGANAKNFSKGWEAQKEHLLIAGEGTKMDKMTAIGIPQELQFNRDTQQDHDRLEQLLGSGLVFAVYDSTDVKNRISNLNRVFPHLYSGKVERYITTKPVARSLKDLLEMKKILRKPDRNGNPMGERFFVHEHYNAKAPLRAFLDHAQEVVAALGAPTQLEISIQEERTAENDNGENRVKSLPDGLMQDLAPHAASISVLMQQMIRSMGYEIPLRGVPIGDIPMLTKVRYSPTDFETYPYEDPKTHEVKQVPIETGFVVEGQTTIARKGESDEHGSPQPLRFIWEGGKGLANNKQITITFKGGEKVVIDLNGNIKRPVAAPEALQYLFTDLEGKPQDNGYGGITAGALLSNHPEERFQNFHDASVVWVMEHKLKELSNGTDPYEYPRDSERPTLRELAQQARLEMSTRRGRTPAVA